MRKACPLIILTCLWIFSISLPAFACRYNVRETGFIDLDMKPYIFYAFIDEETPEEIRSSIQEISQELLSDCNIGFELIIADQQKNNPAIEYLSLWQIRSFPSAVLVSPDGQSMVIDIMNDDEPFGNALRQAINTIISSTVREEIITKAMETYGVILLMEGENTEENSRCRESAMNAIKAISNQMKSMVKHIDRPPVLIILEPQSFSMEKVLLWSLDIDPYNITEPLAAVFYGKARWIGPVMRGEEINEYNLAGILSIIGMDCECDLDISWVRGTVLPARWDQNRQAKTAALLGFDPENPMVKIEAEMILMGPSSYPGVPVISKNYEQEPESPAESSFSEKEDSYLRIFLYSALGLITLIVFIIIVLLLKAKIRES